MHNSLVQTRHQSAFTLIEALAAIVIVSVAMGTTSHVIFAAVDAYSASAVRGQLTAEVSTAMERLSNAIRTIPIRTTGSTVEPAISSTTASSIAWSSASSISLSGTSLRLATEDSPAFTLLENVSSLSIQCFDAGGSALASSLTGTQCDAVHSVSITVTVTLRGVSETIRTRVGLRNLAKGMSL